MPSGASRSLRARWTAAAAAPLEDVGEEHGVAAVEVADCAGFGDERPVEHVARGTAVRAQPRVGVRVAAGCAVAAPREADRQVELMRDEGGSEAVTAQVCERRLEVEHERRSRHRAARDGLDDEQRDDARRDRPQGEQHVGTNATSRANQSPTGRSFARRWCSIRSRSSAAPGSSTAAGRGRAARPGRREPGAQAATIRAQCANAASISRCSLPACESPSAPRA